MTEEADRWQRLVEGLRTGDEQAVREFWQEYGPLLHDLAERRLIGALRRRLDAEDVVQSAFRTFLRRARIGQFQIEDPDGLWRLLCVITINKLRSQARFHLNRKRGLDREVSVAATEDDSSPIQLPDSGQTPDEAAEAAEFADQFQQLLGSLDQEERQIVELKLQGCTNDEVAQQVRCGERTVRRILNRVKVRLERFLEVP